jgi:diacylglycerol kinase (ATP)
LFLNFCFLSLILLVGPLVIFNPTAGSVKKADAVLSQLQRLDPVAVRTTRRRGDAERLAREAIREKCAYLVTAGGDGTLNEVINGIATPQRVSAVQVQLGILPLGTGNDFARALGLPTTIDENIDILLARETARIDLVRMRSNRTRYFANVSAGGFSGIVDEKLTPEMKRTWGPLAYVRSAAAALPKLHAYRAQLVFDDEEKLTIELYNIVIGNGRYVAGGLPIAPDANLRDGLLDVVLIPKRTAPEMALLAAEILLGKHLCSNRVIFRRAKKIAVRSRPGMWFNVDGELIGNAPAVFQVIPRALNFVINMR